MVHASLISSIKGTKSADSLLLLSALFHVPWTRFGWGRRFHDAQAVRSSKYWPCFTLLRPSSHFLVSLLDWNHHSLILAVVFIFHPRTYCWKKRSSFSFPILRTPDRRHYFLTSLTLGRVCQTRNWTLASVDDELIGRSCISREYPSYLSW